jgi:tetratricopeptide (TPR) repeat protein
MKLRIALAAALACALAAPSAMAAPGGGGGSMSGGTPSQREDPQAAYQAGVAALNAQNYREAIRQFRSARRALPNNGTINYALGRAYAGDDQNDRAQEAYETAIRADDAPAGAWLQLGLMHLEAGRRDDAAAQQAALTAAVGACDAACHNR